MTTRPIARARPPRGFTLIEVLITAAICAIGMLGLAKLQAAGLAEASVSRTRSLMALQAESLASMLRSNNAFWGPTTAGAAVPANLIINSSTTPVGGTSSSMLDTTVNCATTVCDSAAKVAGYDLKTWRDALLNDFPAASGAIACTSPTSSAPASCDITLSWSEHYVGINRTTAGGTTSSANNSMMLHVEP
jgi:type IV pilus assembly protein PilV